MSAELEQAEAESFRDSFLAAPAELGLEVLEVAGAVCGRAATMPDERMFNRVVGLGYGGPVTDAQLEEIFAFFDGGPWMVCAAPSAGVEQELLSRGFTPSYAWMRFERAAERLEPVLEDLALRVDDGPTFARIVAAAFDMPDAARPWLAAMCRRPGWECWVAHAGDEPAGAGALYVHEDVGWLGFGGTLREQRGRGAQSALLTHRIRRAAELGATVATTETGVARESGPGPSYRNILRAGFREAYARPNLVAPERSAG